MKINLDEIIDPMEGRIVVTHDSSGHPHARFDLQGLPRVDGMLVGKTALEALKMTEHLCGICPVAHHLAGTRALDALSGLTPLTPAAQLTRRLLHYGSIVEAHSLRFLMQDRDAGVALKRISKKMLVAAGSPGHFPATAVPGGVSVWPATPTLCDLSADLATARDAAAALCDAALASSPEAAGAGDFTGADVALIDDNGAPDVFGTRVRVARNTSAVDEFEFSQWNDRITEEIPGSPAPRPYLRAEGPENGRYRVGPVAQLCVGTLSTPRAATAQARWLAGGRGAAGARAIITLHVLERTEALAQQLTQLVEGADRGELVDPATVRFTAGSGTGLVDGPRGILAHTYTIGADGTIAQARILTPTAQNEPWLAQLLTQASALDQARQADAWEQSIREADPCLPISSAPAGQMGLKVENV
ncbi:nickel-dependent hydrogenase large subunit [Mobiluncus curtisii]|uniref:nickel-dependent hydrogenase large subunit n=1 Tax=Mobiluncus curtisii TaxID=2051 RepID=UPI00147038AF|nr:nickel-dependent hydrogenase large subunit [Mobiluncus curtisii]NMW43671.1 reducing hydrogenase subunit alpha [Mobiluncus curtisii]NMW82382.1 reducing hydrogenase subunit alpha [Mobiluncus curtisii]NMW99209.1 reducing hydrogenase subunit alpha [Mobiluncus curtisii]NMX05545.1 reducing hydrogenase subunit alpha [Mobiluncus curtisii]